MAQEEAVAIGADREGGVLVFFEDGTREEFSAGELLDPRDERVRELCGAHEIAAGRTSDQVPAPALRCCSPCCSLRCCSTRCSARCCPRLAPAPPPPHSLSRVGAPRSVQVVARRKAKERAKEVRLEQFAVAEASRAAFEAGHEQRRQDLRIGEEAWRELLAYMRSPPLEMRNGYYCANTLGQPASVWSAAFVGALTDGLTQHVAAAPHAVLSGRGGGRGGSVDPTGKGEGGQGWTGR